MSIIPRWESEGTITLGDDDEAAVASTASGSSSVVDGLLDLFKGGLFAAAFAAPRPSIGDLLRVLGVTLFLDALGDTETAVDVTLGLLDTLEDLGTGTPAAGGAFGTGATDCLVTCEALETGGGPFGSGTLEDFGAAGGDLGADLLLLGTGIVLLAFGTVATDVETTVDSRLAREIGSRSARTVGSISAALLGTQTQRHDPPASAGGGSSADGGGPGGGIGRLDNPGGGSKIYCRGCAPVQAGKLRGPPRVSSSSTSGFLFLSTL